MQALSNVAVTNIIYNQSSSVSYYRRNYEYQEFYVRPNYLPFYLISYFIIKNIVLNI